MAYEQDVAAVPANREFRFRLKRRLIGVLLVVAGLVVIGTMIGWLGLLGWDVYQLLGLFVSTY